MVDMFKILGLGVIETRIIFKLVLKKYEERYGNVRKCKILRAGKWTGTGCFKLQKYL